MFENNSNPISKGVEKHRTEVELCEMADHVVGVGAKLSETFRSYLRGCKKDDNVLDFTPGVFKAFVDVNQDPSERKQRAVLVFGSGDVDDFELKGFDIAGKAIASLQDTLLVFVGAPDGKIKETEKRLTGCGVPAKMLESERIYSRQREFEALISRSGSCSRAFKIRGFWTSRTRGNVSWSPCARQQQLWFWRSTVQCNFWFSICD